MQEYAPFILSLVILEKVLDKLLDYHPKNARKLKDTAVPTQHMYTKDKTPGKYCSFVISIEEYFNWPSLFWN